MDRINGAGHVDHLFVAEDPATNRPPTEITAEWMNNLQEEVVAIATMDGGALNPAVKTQARDAIVAFFQGRIDALVNASPAALDTLKELADALGNDANFATTITNALALKAPLASPALSGTPSAPTPAQFDSSQKLATTEFATKIGLSAADLLTVAADAVLTAATHVGRTILTGGALANITLQVPLANTVRKGGCIEFMHTGNAAYSAALQRQGTDTINNPAAKTSVSLGFGDTIMLESDGVSQWFAVGGSLAMASGTTTGVFGASFGTSGFQKLPSGKIIQTGQVGTNGSGDTVVAFPIQFPNAVRSIALGVVGSGAGYMATFNTPTVNGMNVGSWSSTTVRAGATVHYIAVGD
ncbi:hypothetical protein SKTS_33290 [Sulfurimicrobium lacus]|uniref:Putative tail fiber protein gp53-like C-terminal domain-containing protein n=1 Tax=Sulfurimicrobium lacus TaxID=2715678 RepID=A0A6F8VF45_9PROT|nr:hypothetical protein [Sulfurimicrobium lacus]BCB28443.1 hypothetical protein SKTS_33290 [Sulfurimicrobium lacus]